MREHPILFSGPMVRAILEGRKTQTRRVVKPQPEWIENSGRWRWPIPKRALRPGCSKDCVTASREWHEYMPPGCCPYGEPGHTLWVRETWGTVRMRELGQFVYGDGPIPDRTGITYRAGRLVRHSGDLPPGTDFNKWPTRWADDYNPDSGRWRPSIHMPKWACRLRLRVEDIRVERLQEISEEDAKAEGVCPITYASPDNRHLTHRYRDGFVTAWDTINGKRAPWSSDPWVWVVRFSRTEAA